MEPVLVLEKYTLFTMAIAEVLIVKAVVKLLVNRLKGAFLYCILMIENS